MTLVRQAATLIQLLGRLHPEALDGIRPHLPVLGPTRHVHLATSGQAAPLNPQPLPPGAPELRLAVSGTVNAVANTAITARLSGGDVRAILGEVGDDWCGTGHQVKIPWPKHWPLPWPPGEPYPIDPDYATPAVQAQAALGFEAYAGSIADKELGAAFSELAERLADAAIRNAG
ncbi:hypothetical protein [Streptomyces sp. CB01881]|uniref:hypothetical protein n=1 Tax=Streptomyces sp. CB01881 TaxID=2078691 RepID=UPI000CDBB90E|nr:hypothetical protein [Streptomyces sp. CB01881]AUY48787.1 hypothetical protein C2142_07365 [Streptomyces sp. CB01881]TYC77276.1 hypothetical protein EH183_07370 [Streptomyces sp. CB01881]